MSKKLSIQHDTILSEMTKTLYDQLDNIAFEISEAGLIFIVLSRDYKVDRIISSHSALPLSIGKIFIPGKTIDSIAIEYLKEAVQDTFRLPIGNESGWFAHSFDDILANYQIVGLLPDVLVTDNASNLFKLVGKLLHEWHQGQLMKQSLENNNSFTFAIMNSLRFGVIAIDLDGHLLYANDTACVMLNIRRRELLTIPIAEIISGWSSIFDHVTAGEKFQNEEVAVQTADGLVKFNINVSPINDMAGHLLGMVISLREIENLYEIVNKYTGMRARFTFEEIVAKSKEMRHLVEYAKTIADSPSTVLIEGESGTGKEVFAQSIHNASSRKEAGFVAINCAAIPENLIESELFGYDDGAFTGAKKGGHPGKFELAHKGTIFLDEIGEMKLDMQAKLLRAIQEGAVMRIGGTKLVPVDVRIIAATNKNLKKEVEKGNFRLDLFYRLSVIPLKIPPLRDRKSDLPSLIRMLMQKKSLRLQKNIPQLHFTEFQQLLDYNWPGNIRELENFIEQLVNLDGKFSFDYFKQQISNGMNGDDDGSQANSGKIANDRFVPYSLLEVEKTHISQMIKHCDGNLSQVARLLGMSRNTLYLKMKKFEI